MKKILFFMAIGCCLVLTNIFPANSQTDPGAYLLLTDYAYTAEDELVGTIVIHGEGRAKDEFVLRGENAPMFKIRKGNQLYIRSKYAKSAEKWFNLTVGTADGQLSANFKVVKDEFNTNGVVAHRGAWKNTDAPQNSGSSFDEAVKLGCEGSEFDVHLTADSVTVLFHDRDKDGLVIEETSYQTLSEEKLSNGEILPTLEAFLESATGQNTTRLVLEIKPSAVSKERGIALTNMIMRQVREAGVQGWIDYISFGYDICQRVLELDPYARVAYLNGDKAPAVAAADKHYGLDYNQKVFREHSEWVDQAKSEGLTLNVWTVNTAEDMDWFLERDFDFITTDEPELLLEKVTKQ